jgi:hypothetical protein
MVRTPDEGCLVHVIGFICDVSIGIEVPDFVGFFCFCGMVFPLDLSMLIEYVDEFLAGHPFVFVKLLQMFPVRIFEYRGLLHQK